MILTPRLSRRGALVAPPQLIADPNTIGGERCEANRDGVGWGRRQFCRGANRDGVGGY